MSDDNSFERFRSWDTFQDRDTAPFEAMTAETWRKEVSWVNYTFALLDHCLCPWDNETWTTLPGVLNPDTNFIVGLLLAICSSLFIGASFIIKKKSLIRVAQKDEKLRAGNGGLGYLSDWVWWIGLLAMAIGEAANFAAYAFVPASLVTPLGVLSVVVTAVLSSYFLKERLNLIGKMSCVLCLLGSTVTVLHAPKETDVQNLNQLGSLLAEPAFVSYLLVVIIVTVLLIFFLAPRYGNSNIFIYVLICSLVGSLSVMAVKGFGLAIVGTVEDNGINEFGNGLTYIFIANMIICVSVQMMYLNKALDVFNTSVVSPIYYVFFTSFVMIASGILYDEFTNLSWFDDLGLLVGFLVIVIAVFMLHLFKDYEISFRDISYIFGPQIKPAPMPTQRRSAPPSPSASSDGRDNPDFALASETTPLVGHQGGNEVEGRSGNGAWASSVTTIGTIHSNPDEIRVAVDANGSSAMSSNGSSSTFSSSSLLETVIERRIPIEDTLDGVYADSEAAPRSHSLDDGLQGSIKHDDGKAWRSYGSLNKSM